MANNSHFPSLEGELTVRRADGSIKQKLNINKTLGKGEIIAKVHSNTGELVSEQRIEFKSFVSNMANMLLASFEGSTEDMKTTSNVTANTKSMSVAGAANDAAYGLIVGANDSGSGYIPGVGVEVNKSNYALRRQFAEGTSTDQLTHSVTTVSYTNGNGQMSLARTFTNSSGSTMTVKEIGVVGKSSTDYFMLARDVNESVEFPWETSGTMTSLSIPVADTEILSITYNFELADDDGLLNSWLGMVTSSMTEAAQLVNTCQINTSIASDVSVDFHTNPTYKLWTALAAVTDSGFLVGTGTANTSRGEFALLDIATTLTHAAQATGELTYPDGEWEEVQNNAGEWKIYKTRVESSRLFSNGTGSAISLTEGAIALAGSAASARVPIVRFKFPSTIVLNDTESLEMTLRISMINNIVER